MEHNHEHHEHHEHHQHQEGQEHPVLRAVAGEHPVLEAAAEKLRSKVVDGHAEDEAAKGEHEAVFPPTSDGKAGKLMDDLKDNEVIGKAATIAVVGVAVALVSVELLPAMLIGAAAALLPGVGKKWTPFFKSTVRQGYKAIRKTREVVAEAGEHLQDAIAEAKNEVGAPIPTPAAGAPVPTPQATPPPHSA